MSELDKRIVAAIGAGASIIPEISALAGATHRIVRQALFALEESGHVRRYGRRAASHPGRPWIVWRLPA